MREQVGGNHYKTVIEPIDYIMKNNLPFCEGNVIKYVTRHRNKNGAEDIKKAIQYLQFILDHEYGGGSDKGAIDHFEEIRTSKYTD